VLAPAGDIDCLRAAMRSGADAVYFGVQAFNARARATNFSVEGLADVVRELHGWGVKAFVTLNTLVFDDELEPASTVIAACAAAGVDAVIVQDFAVMHLVRTIAPDLPIHASTQMTCTDADSVRAAAARGASRVVLARELSVDDVRAIRTALGAHPVELEVFVHGALCVSYSGQCLTSEAIGGRSANRGACAQACRLPYQLVVDGAVRPLDDVAHLLSPEDLEAAALVPALAEAGVACLKIEGRLKGPAYVAATTRLYRAAVDDLTDDETERRRQQALVTYSRGSGPGFLAGVNHQRLVEGETCEHRGVQLGVVRAVQRMRDRALLIVDVLPGIQIERGVGVLVQGGFAGDGELGGRVWDVELTSKDRERTATLWLGPKVVIGKRTAEAMVGRRLFKNDDPAIENALLTEVERHPIKEAVDVEVRGAIGTPLVFKANSARGRVAQAQTDVVLERAQTQPLTASVLRGKLERMGDTPYQLRRLDVQVDDGLTVPLSSLNRARRELTQALLQSAATTHSIAQTGSDALSALRTAAWTQVQSAPPPAGGVFVLCRTLPQAEAAVAAGADGVWLDFLALTGTQQALHVLKGQGARFVGAAPPRIQKPGEEKIARFLDGLPLDGVLVRSLSALDHVGSDARVRVGDFSLNVTNALTAADVLRHCQAFVPSFDLNAPQLRALLSQQDHALAPYAELVVHHPMPLFHTEHCVFAALLSDGADYRSCGRPCERHQVSLRDRVGMDLPVEADVGCRNTIFHAKPQSAAASVDSLMQAGVRRFRIELVRESVDEVTALVQTYRALIAGTLSARDLFRRLRADDGYGVVQGSLRVLRSSGRSHE
jgi:putative protease